MYSMPSLTIFALCLREIYCTDTVDAEPLTAPSENIQIIQSACDLHVCPVGHVCVLFRGNPLCVCNHYCSKSSTTGPLCAWNGRTFESLCQLRTEECKTGKYITVHHYGPCKERRRKNYRRRHASLHHAENGHQFRESCEDSPREARIGLCRAWKKAGSCLYQKALMQMYCKKTCKYCVAEDEEVDLTSCKGTLYGCCKDSMLAALGPNNEGCLGKGCDDVYMCRFFPQFCGNSANELTMRKYCPFTCRYCVAKQRQKKMHNPPKLK